MKSDRSNLETSQDQLTFVDPDNKPKSYRGSPDKLNDTRQDSSLHVPDYENQGGSSDGELYTPRDDEDGPSKQRTQREQRQQQIQNEQVLDVDMTPDQILTWCR